MDDGSRQGSFFHVGGKNIKIKFLDQLVSEESKNVFRICTYKSENILAQNNAKQTINFKSTPPNKIQTLFAFLKRCTSMYYWVLP